MRRTVLALTAAAGMCTAGATHARDMMDPLAVATAFSAAIASGDEATVKALLAPDVLIYESGGQEGSRDEYAAHHLKSDMAFLAKAQIRVLDRKHGASGDLAWVATRSRITGMARDTPVDLYSTESLVLKRLPGGWQIVHVQWSSRPVAPKTK